MCPTFFGSVGSSIWTFFSFDECLLECLTEGLLTHDFIFFLQGPPHKWLNGHDPAANFDVDKADKSVCAESKPIY